MKIPRVPHSWSVTPRQAVAVQRELARQVIRTGGVRRLRVVAGADLAFSTDKTQSIAGVVAWEVESGRIIEQHVIHEPTRFPYVPGLLSFREAPAILTALRKLSCEPDAFLFDGQGLAHPRRFGLACHLGVILDRPSLGCAKSLLVGVCALPARAKGATTPIDHNGETVGIALRSRDGVRPIYVSIGHRLSLASAVEIALACCTRYRLPEPTRLADKLVARCKG